MPNTKITKQKWKDHLFYAKKVYIFGIIIAIGAAALIYTVSGPKKHDENYVMVYFLGYANLDKIEDDRIALVEAGKAHDAAFMGIEFSNLMYEGKESDDPSMAEVYNVQLYAGDNDIFLQNAALTQGVMDADFCAPLEKLKGFNEFVQANPNIEILWQPVQAEVAQIDAEDTEALEALEKHAYAINISQMTGIVEKQGYSSDKKYAVISAKSKNPETSLYVLLKMFDIYAPDFVMPDLSEYATAIPAEQ